MTDQMKHLEDLLYTHYTEAEVAQILFGKKSGHAMLFFENPSVKEPILTTFGKLYPWNALKNRNMPLNSWIKLFTYAADNCQFTLEKIKIPCEYKLFLCTDEHLIKKMNRWLARINYRDRFTAETWREFVLRSPEPEPNPTTHTHPDILWACNHIEEFLKTVSFTESHIFHTVPRIHEILRIKI